MLRTTILLLIILSLIFLVYGCLRGNQSDHSDGHINIDTGFSEDRFIRGIVIDKRDRGLSLQLIGESQKIAETIRVEVVDEKLLGNVVEGQGIKVWFDFIRESNPPQTRGLLIESTDSTQN